MIFITLGSQKFQFNRLLKAVDDLIERGVITEEVFAQSGSSDYKPHHFKTVDFIGRNEFAEKIKEADMVITHAGTGAIMGAVKKGKKVIAVPRKQMYGEHVDNHQFQIVEEFANMNIIEPCYEVEDLENAYCKALKKNYATYVSNTQTYINEIDKYLESI